MLTNHSLITHWMSNIHKLLITFVKNIQHHISRNVFAQNFWIRKTVGTTTKTFSLLEYSSFSETKLQRTRKKKNEII